jgi:transcriptional regulator with XRE-family HTH domain
MTATTRSQSGRDLRAAREKAGLTRVELARLAECSLAQLGSIEQGLTPHRSGVLERAWAVLADSRATNSDGPE